MTDLELLYLVLAVLYLWECAWWVRRGAVGFRTWLGKRWHIAHPGTVLGNARGGFMLANPLPPFGTLLLGYQLPVSISTKGVLAFVSSSVNPGWRPPQTGNWFPWDEIQDVKVSGKKVLINGQPFFKAASPGLALHLKQHLGVLLKASVPKREELLRRLTSDSLDIKAAENRWKQFEEKSNGLRALTNLLFLYVFLAAPLVVYFFGLEHTWLSLLLGILVCTCSASILFRRAHKELYPKAEDERFTHFILVLLSPISAIRACDMLSRPLLETFHPLALAKVFCPDAEFRVFAESLLVELRHPGLPLCPSPDAAAVQTEQQPRASLEEEIKRFLQRAGIAANELVRPPTPADESCHAYCPRCQAQFTTTTGVCEDCGGLKLIAFEQASKVQDPKSEARNMLR